VYIFQRAASAPALPSATATFTFATGALSGLNNGWSASVPAGTLPIWVSTATAFSTGASDTIAAGEWAPAQVLAQNGADGAPGAPGAPGSPGTSAFLATVYIAASSAPAAPSGGSFNFTTGALTPPAGWSITQPPRAPGQLIYASTFNFLTTTPGSTVSGGTWSSPAATTTGPVSPGPSPEMSWTGGATSSSAGFRFRADGTIQQSNNDAATSFTNISAYYAPTGGTPGAGLWIRFTLDYLDVTSGNGGTTGATTGWQQLNADRTVTATASRRFNSIDGVWEPGDLAAKVNYEIAFDSSGLNRATAGSFLIQVSSTT
jgi:hypothetical protein